MGGERSGEGREDLGAIRQALLAWYDGSARDLPWRRESDPYRVWLSEVMLQQTRVETVIPYYRRFLQVYPSLADLSAAGEGEVLKLWEGLGYYARARHFLVAVKEVQTSYGGRIPADPARFRRLPGVGEYTQAAVLSIAFGQPLAAVDGNIRRVLIRLFCLEDGPGSPPAPGEVKARAGALLDRERPGDFNQALMDLGSAICTPKNPRCPQCPVKAFCLARREGKAGSIPPGKEQKPLPLEEITAVLLFAEDRCLVRRRPRKGLLGGLWEFPTLAPPVLPGDRVNLGAKLMVLHHRFSHLRWRVTLFGGELTGELPGGHSWRWAFAGELEGLAFPAVYHPVLERIKNCDPGALYEGLAALSEE